MNGPVYRLFASEDHDWFVLAKKPLDKPIVVLFRGHSREQAYEVWLRDIGEYPEYALREVDMPSGDYEPARQDFL